jgi:hypothetical protein
VLQSEQNNLNVLPVRFVLALKTVGADKEVLKARFVLGGHRDKDKINLVHRATTLKKYQIVS